MLGRDPSWHPSNRAESQANFSRSRRVGTQALAIARPASRDVEWEEAIRKQALTNAGCWIVIRVGDTHVCTVSAPAPCLTDGANATPVPSIEAAAASAQGTNHHGQARR